uniref:Protein kinase domain-containing protein n=1 Tax=Ananas comosus var. bracteatus TaxID=296719 RepID=A0A6V7PIW7_ANACO|nr:unnamed protein product [Ananas comosus var. bracteatus]
MKCFPFLNGGSSKEEPIIKSSSVRSISTTSTDRETRRSGSELNSQNVSDLSSESLVRNQYPSFSQRPSNLRAFTFSELKSATKNFSRSLMVGEGGFGCVYRGSIKDLKNRTRG